MKELTIDLNNYKKNGSVFRRTAVRGIIKRNDKYLIIHSKYGDYKFPGGGKHREETLLDTLVREVKEETDYNVKKETAQEYLKVIEYGKGDIDDMMEMTSYYYFCDVVDEPEDRNLDDYEEEYDYQVAWVTLDEMIQKNDEIKDFEHTPWVTREKTVMKQLMEDIKWVKIE